MKVLQVINNLESGGAEKLLLDSMALYSAKGVDVDVLVLQDRDYPFYKLLQKENMIDLKSLGRGSVYSPTHVFKMMPLLSKYDIIHVHLFPAQYWVVIAKLLSFSKVKLIFTEHSTSNRRLQTPQIRYIEKIIYRFYSKIICITEEVKKELVKKLKIEEDKLVVINNGIDLIKIESEKPLSRSDFSFDQKDVVIVMVAAFRVQKDQDSLIKSLKHLPTNYKLILVGDGVRKAVCENLVKELNLVARVQFLGIRTDVYGIMKMADVAVLSSHWEGFGLVAVEAMACGIPLLASNVPGLAQVVEGAGILFEKGNEVELGEKILNIIQDRETSKDLIEKGIKRAQEYDINLMVEKNIKLYTKIIK